MTNTSKFVFEIQLNYYKNGRVSKLMLSSYTKKNIKKSLKTKIVRKKKMLIMNEKNLNLLKSRDICINNFKTVKKYF